MAQHYYSSTSVVTALGASLTIGGLSISVPEVAGDNGWPTSFPFTLAIDYGLAGMELVDVTAKGILGGGQRGWTITRAIDSTSASAHASGALVRHVMAARDLTEARQARSLQPLDTENTYIIRESVNATEFTDSLVGDLIVKVKSAARVLIGLDGVALTSPISIGSTGVQVNAALIAGAPYPAGAFKRGSGPAFGSDSCYVTRTATFAAANSGWTTIPFNNVVVESFDDVVSSMHSAGVFTASVSGVYVFNAVTTFTSNATGARGIRWVNGSGVVLSSPPIALATNQGVNPMSAGGCMYLTAGTTLAAQVYQGSGGSMTMPANATATPQQAQFTLVA